MALSLIVRSRPALLAAGIASCFALTGCDTGPGGARGEDSKHQTLYAEAPDDAPPGTCWAKDVTPAVIETVTEKVLVQPAEIREDGTVVSEPVFKLQTRQAIVRERKELFFEIPCKEVLTPEFIASVQRALKARGAYDGSISGEMDPRTRRALRRFQAADGLNSSILSLQTARKLGLIAVPRDGY